MSRGPHYEKLRNGRWVDTPMRSRIGCCDCGLVHDVEFRIGPGGQLQRRLHRNERETARVRRMMARRR